MSKLKDKILRAYLQESDNNRFTSQDICDNLRDTISLTPDEVTEYMIDHGYVAWRIDDRLVWNKVTDD